MAHWTAKYTRSKCQKFICSECRGEVFCIAVGNSSKYKGYNYCDYQFCPRCGRKMNIEIKRIAISEEIDLDEYINSNNACKAKRAEKGRKEKEEKGEEG